MTTAPLPDSGDPGGRPPRPDTLARPALWPQPPPGQQPAAYDQLREEDVPSRSKTSVRGAWIATAIMVTGAVLVGLAVALPSVVLAVVGVVVGTAGLVLAWRVKIFATVQLGNESETPQAHGGPAAPR